MVRRISFRLLVLILCCFSSLTNAQDTIPLEIGLTSCDIMPKFKGDIDSFIRNELKYPPSAIKDRIQGVVIVSFMVDTCGCTYNHTIIKGIRCDVNNEALRLSKLIKFEKPAFLFEKPVKVRYNIVVKFHIKSFQKKNKSLP